MEDLLRSFFERDLTETEERKLDSLLETSSRDAFQFLDIAKAHYLQTGLPLPDLSSGGGGHSSLGPGAKVFLSFLSGALVTGSVWWASEHFLRTSSPQASLTDPLIFIRPPLSPIRAEPTTPSSPNTVHRVEEIQLPTMVQPEPYIAGREYRGMSAVVDQAATGLMTVRVLDVQGREIRLLFANILEKGQWNFSWDGRAQSGQFAPAGVYQVEVQSGKSVFRKNVEIIHGKAPSIKPL